jgi:1-deoxy-D-xylulose-5-phosphate synthase
MILDRIHSPTDVRALSNEDAVKLCGELRSFLVNSVSKTGGHLASNLGAVELTVAVHRVFDTSTDRLVFDVGHQCYVHKALTGRKELFSTLRAFGGMSGFPKPCESADDAFIAGHASNSVSVALGMARARTLQRKKYHVLALIGDGALTGGLSYEGLNNAGASGEPLIILLNDNGMSINQSVGGIADHLAVRRTKPSYYEFKKNYHSFMNSIPGGRDMYRFNHRVKTAVKKALWPCSMFEDMGLTYLGPVDGHDLDKLCHLLEWAKSLEGPCIIHIRTVKGKGYRFAEENPDKFHGISKFDPKTGELRSPAGASFSSVCGETLLSLARRDAGVCTITAAMEDGTGLRAFADSFPDRFFDVGIAEGHAVSMAAGLAKQGMKPVFAVYSSFLQRGYDMIMHDVGLLHLHVVFAVDRAGLVGEDGETHHGVFDVGYLSQLPGMTILCPASFGELRAMLEKAVLETKGPVAVRYPRGGEGRYRDVCADGASSSLLRSGGSFTLVSYGTLVNNILDAADMLEKDGIFCDVVKLNSILPLDADAITESVAKTGRLLVLEDCMENGCVGQRIAQSLIARGVAPKRAVFRNIGERFVSHGSIGDLHRSLGFDAESIYKTVKENIADEQ